MGRGEQHDAQRHLARAVDDQERRGLRRDGDRLHVVCHLPQEPPPRRQDRAVGARRDAAVRSDRPAAGVAQPALAAISNLSKTIREGIKTESPEDQLVANASFFQLSTALDAIANTVGACERVKNTPTPFGYVSALRGFLLLWLFTMPFTLIGTYGFVAVPAMALVGFLFLSLEMMAMEIEQPFGDDADDLPLEQYCLGIETVLLDFLKRSPLK